MIRAKHIAHGLLLLAAVSASGCVQKRDLVGRWDMGASNFYFRKDGILFYRTSSGTRYQGRYSYDHSKDPGIVRAELQATNGDREPLSLQLQVTFLSPNRIRFDGAGRGRNRPMMAARVEDNAADAAPATSESEAAPASG
jgi:hypothetical protein